MPLAELLTRWTVRLALLLYAAGLGGLLFSRHQSAVLRDARLAWTAGCGLMWLHLAAAFHFYHGWRHAAAYEATARDTEATIGWSFGGGVYFNYLFAAIWTADVAYWWMAGRRGPYLRARWLSRLIHGFLLFIVLNATITFGAGSLRWIAVLVTVLVIAAGRFGRVGQRFI